MEKAVRQTANNRAEFARIRYGELIKSYTDMDNISGFKARKINQAYTIYCYYLKIFNGTKPLPPSVFKRSEIFMDKRKRSERKARAIKVNH